MGKVTKVVHDLGLATWFGGSVFGILALNPAVEVLDDPEERGKMVDEGWARFQPYGALGLLGALVGHIIMRRNPPRRPTQTYKTTALVQDFLLVGALVSSAASVALGEYADHQEPDAYTPVESATTPNEDTPEETVRAQKGLSLTSWAQLVTGVGLFVCSAILAVEREK